MADKLYYRVGMERRACRDEQGERVLNEGKDGMVWFPLQNMLTPGQGLVRREVAAVFDGVGSVQGDGDLMARDYAEALKRDAFSQDAFLELVRQQQFLPARDRNASTIVSLELPADTSMRACSINLGDSELRRFRAGRLETLSTPHTVWMMILDFAGEKEAAFLAPFADTNVLNQASGDELLEAQKRLQRVIGCLYGQNFHGDASAKVRTALEALRKEGHEVRLTGQQYAARVLGLMIDRCRNALSVDSSYDLRRVSDSLEWSKQLFQVEPGDRYLLHTDGMDVSEDRLRQLLLECLDPLVLANILIEESSGLDDATAMVVDVQTVDPAQGFTRPVFKSLQPTQDVPLAS